MVNDLKAREEERSYRETQILKDLKLCKDTIHMVDKHTAKMVKKILLLTFDNSQQTVKGRKLKPDPDVLIVANVPSYMHVADIMNECTQMEKENFGRLNMALEGEE